MTHVAALRLAALLAPSFRDLNCNVTVSLDALTLSSPKTGVQTFSLANSTATRVLAHAPGFLAAQPLPTRRTVR